MTVGAGITVAHPRFEATLSRPEAIQRPADLSGGDIALVAAVTALLVGFLAPQASTIIQMILAAVFVLLADVRLLPALLALQFTVTDFKGGVAAGMETQYERFEGMVIFVAGLPFTTNYILLLALLIRVLYDVATRPMVFRGTIGQGTALVWLMMLVITAYNSFLGRALGNPSWTAPTRVMLSLGALWYGVTLNRDRTLVLEVLRRRIAPITTVILGMAFCEAVVNRLNWLLIGLGITLAADAAFGETVGRRRPIKAALLAFLSLAVGFGFRATPAMLELAKRHGAGFSATLTTMLVPVISAGLALLCWPRRSDTRSHTWSRRSVSFMATSLYVMFCAFPFVVSALTMNYDPETTGRGEDVRLRDRIAYKLLAERAAIWRGAIDQIGSAPYVFIPAGRDGYLITNSGKSGRFTVGSHNVVLETLRSQGLVVGPVTLWFFYLAFLAASKACLSKPDPVARILGPPVIAVTVGTGVSGASMLDPNLSFLTLVFAGICMAGDAARAARSSRTS